MHERATSPPPMVGRGKEQRALEESLERMALGQGGLVAVSGPAGIGKTRLLRWVEDTGRSKGYDVRWAYCLKESNQALFPFAQLFRGTPEGEGSSGGTSLRSESEAAVQIFEEEKPTLLFQRVASVSNTHDTIIVTRERAQTLRQRFPTLAASAQVVQLSRVESPESINPTSLDGLGERLERHFADRPNSVAVLSGLEYLVSQNGFLPVLRLVQFLRDTAESSSGWLLLSLHPEALEKREVALLRAEGDVMSVETPPERAPVGAEAPAQAMLRYLHDLEQASHRAPQILFLDDLQWADPESLTATQFLARNVRNLRVLLVASLREGEELDSNPSGDNPLVEALDGMEREGTVTRVRVHPLTESALAELCASVIGAPPALGKEDGSLSPLLERAGGNPYFLLELTRQMVEEGILIKRGDQAVFLPPDHAKATSPIDLPDTLKRLVRRRLRMLTAEERVALEMAAVAGSEFDEQIVATALRQDPASISNLFRVMAQHHAILDRVPGFPGRWSFGHPLVWEGTLSEIPDARLRQDAAGLAHLAVSRPNPDVETTARLFYLARDGTQGPVWVRKAIERALLTHAYQAAVTYHEWLQDLLEAGGVPPDEREKEGLEWFVHFYLKGATLTRIRVHFRTLEPIPASRPLKLLEDAYRYYLTYTLRPAEGLARFQRSLEAARTENVAISPVVAALAKATEGNTHYSEGEFEHAMAEYRAACECLPEDAPRWIQARLYYDRGWVAGGLALHEECRACLQKGFAVLHGEETEKMTALLNNLAAETALHRGELDVAEEYSLKTTEAFRALGNMTDYGASLSNLAYVCECKGDRERERKYLTEGMTLCERFGMSFVVSLFRVQWARLHSTEGKPEEALRELELALPDLVATSAAGPPHFLWLTMARVQLDRGDAAKAGEALAHIARPDKDLPPEEVPRFHWLRSEVALRQGRRDEARKEIDLSLACARQRKARYDEALALDVLAAWERAHGTPEEVARAMEAADRLYKSTGGVRTARSVP